MSKSRIFADGLESISFIEGMVHMELFNFIPGTQKDKNQRPERELTEELIMTPQGFLRAYSAMEKLVTQLVDAGAIQRNANENKPQVAEAEKKSSPNF
ncbi:MAG: hypothetical protein WC071_02980 [Victivallaceae bacterium]